MGFVKKLLLVIQGKPRTLDEKIKRTEKQIKSNKYFSLFFLVLGCLFVITCAVGLKDSNIAFDNGQITKLEHIAVSNVFVSALIFVFMLYLFIDKCDTDIRNKNLQYRLEKLEKESVDGGA